MAITFVGTSSNSGTGSVSVAAVANTVAGDFVLLSVMSANENVSTPTNYTPIGTARSTGTAATAGGVRITCFYRILAAADNATTVPDSGNVTLGTKVVYRGVDPDTPFDVTAGSVQSTASTTMTWPGVTTTVNDCLIVMCCAVDTDAASTATSGALTHAGLTSVTERADSSTSSATGGGIVVNDGFCATAGTTGTGTSTGSTSVVRVYQTFALRTSNIVLASMVSPMGAFTLTFTAGPQYTNTLIKAWNGTAWVLTPMRYAKFDFGQSTVLMYGTSATKVWTPTGWQE